VDFTLKKSEVELLRRILPHYVSELRMEVAGTDSYDMRQRLKSEEEILKGLISRLLQADQGAA
jgi:hypothetical protein